MLWIWYYYMFSNQGWISFDRTILQHKQETLYLTKQHFNDLLQSVLLHKVRLDAKSNS